MHSAPYAMEAYQPHGLLFLLDGCKQWIPNLSWEKLTDSWQIQNMHQATSVSMTFERVVVQWSNTVCFECSLCNDLVGAKNSVGWTYRSQCTGNWAHAKSPGWASWPRYVPICKQEEGSDLSVQELGTW